MSIEEVYKNMKQFTEITKEQYLLETMNAMDNVELLTDFVSKFDLQGKGTDLPGVLGRYVDFMDSNEPNGTKDDLETYRVLGSELMGIYKTSIFESRLGEHLQAGTLEILNPGFSTPYLDVLDALKFAMYSNAEGLRPAFTDDYQYFLTQDNLPIAIPNELVDQMKEPETINDGSYM